MIILLMVMAVAKWVWHLPVPWWLWVFSMALFLLGEISD